MKDVKWAVLGCGHIAKTFVQSIKHVPDTTLVACAASHLDRAKMFASEHGISQHFGSYEEMLQQRSINAVYIATTHNFHFEHIKLCLMHGKHVLCEKPITLNAKQADEVYRLAVNHNLLLVEAVWTRFLPAITDLQTALKSGVIGQPKCVQANFSLNRQLPDTHRLRNKKLAGGALLDLGIYPITIADIVFNKSPTKITSSAIMTPTGVDETSFYTLEYENGSVAQLSAGFTMSGPSYAHIQGDKGCIKIPNFLGATAYELTLEGAEPVWHRFDFADDEKFSFEIAHVNACLKADYSRSDIMPSETSLRVMGIMDTIRGQWGLAYEGE